MTQLLRAMLEELQRRNYSPSTIRHYLRVVEQFARYFGKPPDELGPEHVRRYQAHLLQERNYSASTVVAVAALRFFFVKTLNRDYKPEQLPYPKQAKRLPTVLSRDEVRRLIDSASNLYHRALLTTLYATGMRRAEVREPEGDRHRQRAHAGADPARQVGPRSRCSAEPGAAGNPARVLVLDETEDLPVPRHEEGRHRGTNPSP